MFIRLDSLPLKEDLDGDYQVHVFDHNNQYDYRTHLSKFWNSEDIGFEPIGPLDAENLSGAVDALQELDLAQYGLGYFKVHDSLKLNLFQFPDNPIFNNEDYPGYDYSVGVGPGEDAVFEKLSDAIRYFATDRSSDKLKPVPSVTRGANNTLTTDQYSGDNSWKVMRIVLLDGYVWDESIELDGASNLRHLFITSHNGRTVFSDPSLDNHLMKVSNGSQSPVMSLTVDMRNSPNIDGFIVEGPGSVMKIERSRYQLFDEEGDAYTEYSQTGLKVAKCTGVPVKVHAGGTLTHNSNYIESFDSDTAEILSIEDCSQGVIVDGGTLQLQDSLFFSQNTDKPITFTGTARGSLASIVATPPVDPTDGLRVSGSSNVTISESLMISGFTTCTGVGVDKCGTLVIKGFESVIENNLVNIHVDSLAKIDVRFTSLKDGIDYSVLATRSGKAYLFGTIATALDTTSQGNNVLLADDLGVITYSGGGVSGGLLSDIAVTNLGRVRVKSTNLAATYSQVPGTQTLAGLIIED